MISNVKKPEGGGGGGEEKRKERKRENSMECEKKTIYIPTKTPLSTNRALKITRRCGTVEDTNRIKKSERTSKKMTTTKPGVLR